MPQFCTLVKAETHVQTWELCLLAPVAQASSFSTGKLSGLCAARVPHCPPALKRLDLEAVHSTGKYCSGSIGWCTSQCAMVTAVLLYATPVVQVDLYWGNVSLCS